MRFFIIPIANSSPEQKEQLRQVRNGENVSKFMFSKGEITKEIHERWCAAKENSYGVMDITKVVVDIRSSKAVGLYRYWFDPMYNAGNWSMYSDILSRDRYIGIYCELKAIEDFFSSKLNKTDELVSEVIGDNRIGKLHQKIGFRKESDMDGRAVYRLSYTDFVRCRARFDAVIEGM